MPRSRCIVAITCALMSLPCRSHAQQKPPQEPSQASPTLGQGGKDDLKREIEELRRLSRQQQKVIEELQKKMEELESHFNPGVAQAEVSPAAAVPAAAATKAESPSAAGPAGQPNTPSISIGGAVFRLTDISLDVIGTGGGTTRRGGEPAHAGMYLPQAEYSLSGGVDPYFTAEGHVVHSLEAGSGQSSVSLDEVFATTSSLSYGLQVKAGLFLTEFDKMNPSHPHSWDWVDPPVVNARMFGEDGLRAPGARLSWLAPLPWHSQLYFSAQDPSGAAMGSFLGRQSGPWTDPSSEPRSGVGGWPQEFRRVKGVKDLV
jgi:hypothetical protein